jgi:hypothetical protein
LLELELQLQLQRVVALLRRPRSPLPHLLPLPLPHLLLLPILLPPNQPPLCHTGECRLLEPHLGAHLLPELYQRVRKHLHRLLCHPVWPCDGFADWQVLAISRATAAALLLPSLREVLDAHQSSFDSTPPN